MRPAEYKNRFVAGDPLLDGQMLAGVNGRFIRGCKQADFDKLCEQHTSSLRLRHGVLECVMGRPIAWMTC